MIIVGNQDQPHGDGKFLQYLPGLYSSNRPAWITHKTPGNKQLLKSLQPCMHAKKKSLAVSMNCLTSVHACTVNAVRNRRRTRFLTFQEYFSSTETQPMSVLQNICFKLTVLLLNMERSSSPHPVVDTNRCLHLLGLNKAQRGLISED